MKDYSMSRRYHRDGNERRDYEFRRSESEAQSFKHVLKERYHKESMDEERNRKRDKERNDSKHSNQPHKRDKRSNSPHHKSHKNSTIKSKVQSETSHQHKNKKHTESNDNNESYEELSRKKRKLESELRALDLEEAAEKEAENKKARRDKSKHKHKEENLVRVKDEVLTDDEQAVSRKKGTPNFALKEEKDKCKNHTPKSDDDRGWGKSQSDSKKVDKEKPNFGVSGKLAEDTNTYNGVVIKYNEPPEARKPKRRWRLYPFKGDSDLPFIPIHRQSAYLFGRTRLIADIPIDHPSCSKQHAVLQYRLVPYKREDGTTGRRIRPYVIDLESSNGTYVNNSKIEPRCYVELMEKDVIKFGYSSREYVLLHEESKNSDEDDDVVETETEK